MTCAAIPTSPEELSPAWITAALRQSGTINGTPVRAISVEQLGEGHGFMGQVVRLRLEYDGEDPSAPKTVVAKFPSVTKESRQIARAFRLYERELDFYARLSGDAPVEAPACYFQAIDRGSQRFVVLLEDLGALQRGDQIAGSTAEQTLSALTSIARLHAKYWGRVDGGSLDWVADNRDADVAKLVAHTYNQSLRPTFEAFPEAFTSETRAIAEALGPRLEKMLTGSSDCPRTLVHGDFRADNLLYRDDGSVVVLDWQIVCRGEGAFDVGYHMSQSVAPDVRRAIEQRALRQYHRTLVENGVSGYSFSDFWDDYREAILVALLYPVCVCGSLDVSHERGRALGRMMLERAFTAIVDSNAIEMLPALD